MNDQQQTTRVEDPETSSGIFPLYFITACVEDQGLQASGMTAFFMNGKRQTTKTEDPESSSG